MHFDYGIVGFSGAIGQAITHELALGGYRLLLIGRSKPESCNFDYFEWQMGEESSEIMQSCSKLVYCAYSRLLPSDSEPWNDQNVRAVNRIIDSLSEDQGFILISSKSASFKSKSHYGRVKFFQELAASKHPSSIILRVPWLESQQSLHLDRAKGVMARIASLDFLNLVSWRFLDIETCNIDNILQGILNFESHGNYWEVESSGTMGSILGLDFKNEFRDSWARQILTTLSLSVLLLLRKIGPRKFRLLADSALSLF